MANNTEIQNIKDRVDLVEFIGEYVQLTKSGTYFKARCPFHQEKTPSFMVSPDRGRWQCFGCNEGGDCFTFLEKIEGVSFAEALTSLAQRAGITLTRSSKTHTTSLLGTSIPNVDEKDIVRRVLLSAASVYAIILKDASYAKDARAYLEQRGVSEGTQKKFMLGYAPDSWDVVYRTLLKYGYSARDMERAGLVSKNERGSYFDRFRDRIMYPIHNHHGILIGFTGRMVHNKEGMHGGKYVNSPQTELFDKGRMLYGLHLAKQAIRVSGEAIVVEGQMDLIASHDALYLNTVASSGTALSEEQLVLLKRYCSRLKFAFDNDEAGRKAAMRGIEIALSLGFEVRVIRLYEGDGLDPDACIRRDKNVWKQRVDSAQPYIMWAMEEACARFDVHDGRGKSSIARMVLPLIEKLPSPVEKDHYIQELSHLLQISREALQAELKIGVTIRRAPSQTPQTNVENGTVLRSQPYMLLLALHVRVGADKARLSQFHDKCFPSIFHPLVRQLKEGYTDATTIQTIDELQMRITFEYSAYSLEELKQEYERVHSFCTARFKKQRIATIAHALRDAETRGDNERIAKLLSAYQLSKDVGVDPNDKIESA